MDSVIRPHNYFNTPFITDLHIHTCAV